MWCIYGDITNAKCEHLANFSPVITWGKANFGKVFTLGHTYYEISLQVVKNLTNTTTPEASNISKSVNIHNLWLHNLIELFSLFFPSIVI